MRFDMSYAAAVSDPRIADESMTSELFSGLEGSNIGFLFPVFVFSRKGNSPPYGPRVKGGGGMFYQGRATSMCKKFYTKKLLLSAFSLCCTALSLPAQQQIRAEQNHGPYASE